MRKSVEAGEAKFVAASQQQLQRICDVAFDPVGPPERQHVRIKFLVEQQQIADIRSRAELNDRLLKQRVT